MSMSPEIQNGLNLVTLVMCIVTLTLATAALMPQLKQGLIMIRDGLLWALLIGVVGVVGLVGWGRLYEVRQERARQAEFYDPVILNTRTEFDPVPRIERQNPRSQRGRQPDSGATSQRTLSTGYFQPAQSSAKSPSDRAASEDPLYSFSRN